MINLKKSNNGITLIALVITIIVLLILAGVSIAMLTGENGILKQANNAKNKTEEAKIQEKKDLENLEDEITNIIGIDWEEALKTATKHPEQKESNSIGVGTNGKAVNMDLWVYSLMDDGTYGLNTKENLNTETSVGVTSGYKGWFTSNGEIQGTIPQYISEDGGETFKEVTDLKWLFFNCSEMKIAPQIPTTVKKMNYTFRKCVSLKNTPKIPDGVLEMSRTFQECENLENITNLPNTVINLAHTFDGCKNLKSVNLVIPNSVTNMQRTFYHCENLNGEIEINANLNGFLINNETDYVSVFGYAVTKENCKLILSGNCKVLSSMISETGNPNIILKQ